ncbi:MAG: type II toxin-antitoxin system RelE/ParE family toxin [Bryobacter sp.]|nr:type II toxin-antitoxin system RelE/ParE family toxin [Bryobacter sp.]
MKHFIRPAARADILQQYNFYQSKGAVAVADNFLQGVEAAITDLTKRPVMGSPKASSNPLLSGLRTWPVNGFPDIRVYYLIHKDTLIIIRVLHGKQNTDAILEEG